MGLISRKPAVLLLEDGSVFKGNSLGKIGSATGEICYNTGMTGYQEIYTDPSYFGQIIINTSSHIGNYGTVDEEQESKFPQINGVIINEYSEVYSRSNSEESLEDINDIFYIGKMDSHNKKFVLFFKTREKAILARGEEFNYITDYP